MNYLVDTNVFLEILLNQAGRKKGEAFLHGEKGAQRRGFHLLQFVTMDKQFLAEILRYVAIVVVVSVAVLVGLRVGVARAYEVLRHWAAQNDFELLRFKRCFFTGGFNPLTTGRGQIVYFVTIRDLDQRERSGWVRCGSRWDVFCISDRADVKWME